MCIRDSLIVIFMIGYVWRFTYIEEEIKDAMDLSEEGEGGSWVLISYVTGEQRNTTGGVSFTPQPLYDLVPEWVYLFSRYAVFGLLLFMFGVMVYSLVKVDRKRLMAFDLLFVAGSVVFLFAGFVSPRLLGQRATQSLFLTPVKYFGAVGRALFAMVALVIMISPVMFTFNVTVNHTLTGNMFIEDDSTLEPGRFVQDHRPGNITVLTSDRRFYPVALVRYYREIGYINVNPFTFLNTEEEIGIEDTDIILYSPKLENRMGYFGLEETLEYRVNCSCIYDEGGGKVYLVP
jgi:hypothetical protein